MSVENNVSGLNSLSLLSVQVILNDLDRLTQLANSMLEAQKGPTEKFLAEQRKQDKEMERLARKLAAYRLPQNQQQLNSIKAKIAVVAPKLQALGKTDVSLKLTSMMGQADEMKQQIAAKRALAGSGPAAPIDTGLI